MVQDTSHPSPWQDLFIVHMPNTSNGITFGFHTPFAI
jgi:hypothetical protein